MARYASRRPEVADPTGDLATESLDLLAIAAAWLDEPLLSPEELDRRRALVADAEWDIAARVANPDSGRLAQLDAGFEALGYRDGDRR